MEKTLLIIPAYNEEESLPAVIARLREYPYSFLVVNDGSKDRTGPVCRELGVRHLDLPFNMGLAGAFQSGVRYAARHGYDRVIQFDADGQHLPEYIDTLLQQMDRTGCDIVIGSRNLEGQTAASMRGLGMRLIRLLIRVTTGQTITDPTSGMRLYNRRMIDLFANNINFGPEPDTLAYLMKNGVCVTEAPVTMEERIAGQSYLRMWSAIRYMCRVILSIVLIQFVRPRLSQKEA